MYSTAACIFEVKPVAVAAPESAEDVCAILEYAAANQVPVIPRGGGSSLAGQAVGAAIILDFTRFMNNVIRVDRDGLTATVQPGVVLGRLNRLLARDGLVFAPDPSSANYCTIGGMIANNAGGARSVKYGSTTDHVLSLKAALAGGRVLDTSAGRDAGPDGLYRGLEELLRGKEGLIGDNGPRTAKNSSGYNLAGALGLGRAGTGPPGQAKPEDGGALDLCKLMVGSEGTLGAVVEATLKLSRLPAARGSLLVGLSSLEAAGEAIVRVLDLGPSALELMGQTFLELVDRKDLESPGAFMSETDTALLIEFEGDREDEVGEKLDRARRVLENNPAKLGEKVMKDPSEARQVWGLRSAAVAILNRMEGPEKPIAFIEDVTVTPSRLPEFIRRELEIFERYKVRAGVFGHGGDGNLHVRPVLNLKDPEGVGKMRGIAEDVYELAAQMGGSPTGEHGDGRLRTGFIEKFYGEVTPLFARVKSLFDPSGIMNPGDKTGDGEYALDKNLRYGASYRTIPTGEIFDEPDITHEIEKCHGCGACRDYCPVGSTTVEESGSARTKANLLRSLVTGRLGDPKEVLKRDDWKSIFDLCFNCKLCLTECPTRVDVPRLAAEARACYAREKGLDKASMFVAGSFEISRVAALTPRLSNLGLKARPARALLQKLVGVDRRRELPSFSRRPMVVPSAKPRAGRKVLYFPGCFALFNDAEDEGRASVEILEAAGASVWVPSLECCGMARLTVGDKAGAARRARGNVDSLFEAVQDGYTIVASAASCCLAIKEDYPLLVGTDKARAVAASTFDLFEYLADAFSKGEIDARPGPLSMKVVHHAPCHLLAQGVADSVEQVLRMIPGLEIIDIDDGCCGMAGTFGMKSRNFDLSMRIGKALFDEVRRASPDVVVTGCGTCKIQLEQGTGLEVRHPIWLLRKAFENRGEGAVRARGPGAVRS